MNYLYFTKAIILNFELFLSGCSKRTVVVTLCCGKSSYSIYLFLHNTGTVNGLRHSATSRKVAGSIPDGFIGIFQ